MATTIVSPMARETAMMRAATMPEIAAGKTTRRVVVARRAPRPYEASRRLIGTARMASSAMEAMSGMIRIPTPTPATRRLNPAADVKTVCTTFGLMNVRAKKPRTTLGIPARISRMGLIVLRDRGLAYSDR
jgi:hypothetical protein